MGRIRVTILGCGGSGGVPVIGGDWGACNPANPKNRRLRASILAQTDRATVLIDTSPDLREQLLAAGVGALDAVLYTHAHADHVHGIDDLRCVNRIIQRPVMAYASAEAMAQIQERFGYAFKPQAANRFFHRPVLTGIEIDGPFEINGLSVIPFEQDHGTAGRTLGFRMGRIAYSTDALDIPDSSLEILKNIDTWIVDCVRYESHPTHANVERALAMIDKVKPRRAILTHMNEKLDYDELAARLPRGVEPAYDGMTIDVS